MKGMTDTQNGEWVLKEDILKELENMKYICSGNHLECKYWNESVKELIKRIKTSDNKPYTNLKKDKEDK